MNDWCQRCDVGYMAGVAIKSRKLFEALDPHGHEIPLELLKCEKCRAAIKTDDYCEDCRIGWVEEIAHMSRISYYVARGEPRDLRGIHCATCLKNADEHGWCDACDRGMVGNVAINIRSDYPAACRAYDLMMAAINELPRCERCALCILTDFECHICKITWKDGKPAAGVNR